MGKARSKKRPWRMMKSLWWRVRIFTSPFCVAKPKERLWIDESLRPNALFLHGPPIAHLPTARLFAYATHFDARPLGLEWVNDTTCVLVFSSAKAARSAFAKLQRNADAAPDEEGLVEAHRVPITLWPAKALISKTVVDAQGGRTAGVDAGSEGGEKGNELSAPLRLRWARIDDVKKRGAASSSRFYATHGETAGKEVFNPATGRAEVPTAVEEAALKRKRQRGNGGEDRVGPNTRTVQDLDDELDSFLAEGSPPPGEERMVPEQPKSKMRSDGYDPEANAGRSLLERTSVLRAHPELSASHEGDRRRRGGTRREGSGGRERHEGGGNPRPKRTAQELDDELDAFLSER
jgi:hypothetical protein